jgi:hypothetical protein
LDGFKMKMQSIALGSLILCNGIGTLHAETPRLNGSLARDRLVTSGLDYAPKTAAQLLSTYDQANAIRNAEKDKGTSGLSKALAKHNIATAKNGFDLEVTKSVTLLVEVPLAMTGPVGMAAGGIFKMTVDRMVTGVIEKRQQQVDTILRASISKLSDNQIVALKQENGTGAATTEFQKFIREAVDLSGTGTDAQKSTINTQMMGMVASLSAETLKEQRALALDVTDLVAITKSAVLELKRLDDGLLNLENQMKGVKEEIGTTKNMLDSLTYANLKTNAEKANYLRKGGLASLDPMAQKELLDKVDTLAKIESVNQKFDQANKVLGGLQFIATTLIKDENAARVIGEVSDAAQKGQALFNTFAAFATGGPLGGLMAMGSLGAVFGGGSDPLGGLKPELNQIKESLKEINAKLDQVIDLQKQTLESLDGAHRKLDDLHYEIASLDRKVSDSTATILEASWKDVYSKCRNLALSFRLGELNIAIPFKSGEEYQRYHFLNNSQLTTLVGDDGKKCFEGLNDLSQQPNSIRLISDNSSAVWQGKTDGVDLTLPAKFKKVRTELARQIQRVKLPADNADALIETGLLYLTRPSNELGQMLERAGGEALTVLSVDRRPCWWRGIEGMTEQKSQCAWSEPQANGESFAFLKGDKYAHPWRTTEFMDYALSFYPQHFLPTQNSQNLSTEALINMVDAAISDGSKMTKVRGLLQRSLRLTEIAIAHEALLEGDLIAPLLADELLKPAGGDDTGLDKTCVAKWASIPAGIAAPANAFLYENPRIAHLTLRLVLYRLIFGDAAEANSTSKRIANQPDLNSERITNYEWRRLNAPGAWTSPTAVANGVSPYVNSAQSAMAHQWWSPWTSLLHVPVGIGLKGTLANTVPDKTVARGWEFHYAPSDGSKATVMQVTKSSAVDSCGGYMLTPTEVAIPKGWSISAGGLVMSLPGAASLVNQTVEYNAPLSALLERRAALHSELFSLVDRSIEGIENAYEYRLMTKAREILK